MKIFYIFVVSELLLPIDLKGWKIDCDTGTWNIPKFSQKWLADSMCSNLYAWTRGDPICSISIILVGEGQGKLDFGNCWSDGFVKVYLNGIEIGSANPNEFKVASFNYTNGSELEIQELSGAIIQLNKVDIN